MNMKIMLLDIQEVVPLYLLSCRQRSENASIEVVIKSVNTYELPKSDKGVSNTLLKEKVGNHMIHQLKIAGNGGFLESQLSSLA